MTDTTVKYFHSAMPGAPVLSGQAGALIGVLDACLVNGFGLGTLDSLIIAGGIATATRAAGHSQEAGSVALIAGATVTGGSVNGERKVLTATATTFTFDATGISNQTATGTITQKIAPATWAKTYSGTNKAAYKPSDVTATGCMLRVDDTGTTNSRIVGYETMSDVDTGTGPFPTPTQISGGLYWTKSSAANSTGNAWMLFSDGRMFYFARAYRSGNNAIPNDYELHAFGDIVPTKSGDAYSCVISGNTSDASGGTVSGTANYWYNTASVAPGLYCARSYTSLGSSINVIRAFPVFNQGGGSLASGANSTTYLPYPNPTDGGLYVVSHNILESNNALRGVSPGFYCVPQSIPSGAFAPRDSVTGVTGLAGRTLKAVTVQSGTVMTCFFDVTGPWR